MLDSTSRIITSEDFSYFLKFFKKFSKLNHASHFLFKSTWVFGHRRTCLHSSKATGRGTIHHHGWTGKARRVLECKAAPRTPPKGCFLDTFCMVLSEKNRPNTFLCVWLVLSIVFTFRSLGVDCFSWLNLIGVFRLQITHTHAEKNPPGTLIDFTQDWTCPSCGDNVFAWRSACNRCGSGPGAGCAGGAGGAGCGGYGAMGKGAAGAAGEKGVLPAA